MKFEKIRDAIHTRLGETHKKATEEEAQSEFYWGRFNAFREMAMLIELYDKEDSE